MSSFFLVFFIATTFGILFCGILDVPSIGLGTLEAGVRALVPVGVTVVMLGLSHGTAAPPPEVFTSVPPLEVFPLPPLSDSLLSRR